MFKSYVLLINSRSSLNELYHRQYRKDTMGNIQVAMVEQIAKSLKLPPIEREVRVVEVRETISRDMRAETNMKLEAQKIKDFTGSHEDWQK